MGKRRISHSRYLIKIHQKILFLQKVWSFPPCVIPAFLTHRLFSPVSSPCFLLRVGTHWPLGSLSLPPPLSPLCTVLPSLPLLLLPSSFFLSDFLPLFPSTLSSHSSSSSLLFVVLFFSSYPPLYALPATPPLSLSPPSPCLPLPLPHPSLSFSFHPSLVRSFFLPPPPLYRLSPTPPSPSRLC